MEKRQLKPALFGRALTALVGRVQCRQLDPNRAPGLGFSFLQSAATHR